MTFSKASVLRVILLILWSLFAGKQALAQDPQFSQFYANPIYTNPAFAGTSNVGRIVINMRNQWPSIAGAFRTGALSYDEHFKSINGGFGIQATYDEQGVGTLKTNSINFIYSYMLEVNRRFTIRMAIQAGMFQKTLDFSKLLWYDQIILTQGFVNPTAEPPGNPSILSPNFATGIVGYSKDFFIGIAVHNLLEPEQNFFPDQPKSNIIPRRYTVNTGYVIALNDATDPKYRVNLSPNVIFKSQRQFNQLNLGLYLSRGSLVAGAYFRQNSVNADAFIILLGYRTQKVKVGYSYDATLSAARTGAVNSHEVSLAFELKKRIRRPKFPILHCPDY